MLEIAWWKIVIGVPIILILTCMTLAVLGVTVVIIQDWLENRTGRIANAARSLFALPGSILAAMLWIGTFCLLVVGGLIWAMIEKVKRLGSSPLSLEL